MNWPKISIVTPNLNQEVFLEQTILSVLNQNYPNLEYIIIDGGSTDSSLSIIKKYETQLFYWISEKDKGLYDALNKGFCKSTGEVMMYINSDDILLAQSLSTIGMTFEKFKNIRWLNGIHTFIDEKSRIVESKKPTIFTIYDYLMLNYQWIQQESTCWRRSLWEESGSKFNENLKLAGDLDLWSRFFLIEQLYFLNTTIGAFRFREGQLSANNLDNYHQEAIASLKLLKSQITKFQRVQLLKIKLLLIIQKVLKYSVIFDLYIFRKITLITLEKIKSKPKIYSINTQNLKIE
ncbi:MAG: glycosyltransferase [Flavobacterium sp.]|nr:glycosyltransferase [Flavobacterium sp.]